MLSRVSWRADLLSFRDEPMFWSLVKYDMKQDRQRDHQGNLTSSYLNDSNLHAPVLDIDVPVRLIKSSTPGHCHLYFDLPVSRWRMMIMLFGMMIAGVVEPGFFWWSIRRGGTFVRKPYVAKTPDETMKYTYGMFFKLREFRGRS